GARVRAAPVPVVLPAGGGSARSGQPAALQGGGAPAGCAGPLPAGRALPALARAPRLDGALRPADAGADPGTDGRPSPAAGAEPVRGQPGIRPGPGGAAGAAAPAYGAELAPDAGAGRRPGAAGGPSGITDPQRPPTGVRRQPATLRRPFRRAGQPFTPGAGVAEGGWRLYPARRPGRGQAPLPRRLAAGGERHRSAADRRMGGNAGGAAGV